MKFKNILAFSLSFVMIMSAVGIVSTAEDAPSYDRDKYYLDSIAEYDQFDYSDPQYITDEDFFGVWDAGAGEWSTPSHFDYEKYPEMAAVCEAAKIGDYQGCKEELLEYYLEKDRSYDQEVVSGVFSSRERARYESAMDNFFSLRTYYLSAKGVFGESAGWVGIDVTPDFEALAVGASTEKDLKYVIAAGKKDGYRVEIDKTGSNAPYVSAVINGETVTYPLAAATYVDGTEPDISHKNSEKLLVEESVTSIGADMAIDENTKCAFMQFRFPGLSENDQITSATLYLYGKMTEDDIADEPRIPADCKSVYLTPWSGTVNVDEDMTFNQYISYPRHYASFSGESSIRPIEQYRGSGLDGSTAVMYLTAPNAVTGYQATGDETFAYHAIRLFLGRIITLGDYEAFCDVVTARLKSALDAASWGFNIVDKIDKLMESKHMTPEAFTILMKHTYMRGRWLEEHWPSNFNTHNHGSYGVTGLTTISLYYPEFRAVHGPLWTNEDGSVYLMDETLEGSVRGGWMEVAKYRRAFKMSNDNYEDGSSVEGSTSYALEGMGSFLIASNLGERLNIDVSDWYGDEKTDAAVEKALTYIISKLNPMFGDFQVGDGHAWDDDYPSSLRKYSELIDNPYLEYVVTRRESGEEPPFKTKAYDDSATAVFRNSWEDDYAIAAHFEARGGGSHNHNDDGNLVLFAYGNYLLVDPRQGNYLTTDPQERWVSSTRGHNTIEINNAVMRGYRSYLEQMDPIVFAKDENGNPVKDENGVEMVDDPLIVPIYQIDYRPGSLFPENREINEVYDFMRAESLGYTDNNAATLNNEDYQVKRDVLFLRSGYFVVTDYIKPEYGETNGANDYKQLWHFLPNANMTVDEETNVMRTNFPGKANLIVATVKNNENMTANYKYGLYGAARGKFEVCKYGTFEQNKLGTATYNTLLYPMRAGDDAEVITKNIELDLAEDEANAFMATVTDTKLNESKDIYYYTLFDEEKKAPITFGAYNTDGSVALSEKGDSGYVNAVLRRGSYLENIMDDEYAIYSTEEIEDIGVYWQLDEIDIAYNTEDSYNNEIDLTKLTVKANTETKTVRLNGEEIPFKQQGRYVYFGETPIIEDEEEDANSGGEEDDSSSGGSSGSHGGTGGGSSSGGGISFGGGNTVTPAVDDKKPSDAYSEDLKDHWAQKEITELLDKEVVRGLDDGTLGLDRSVTRAEFVTMLVRALGAEVKEYNGAFSDVSPESWYADAIETARQNGWIEGDGENAYPERNITREEITKILVSVFEQKYGEISEAAENSFTDSDAVSSWAVSFVNKAVAAGLINGMDNGTFSPRESAKREQAMVLIYRLINKEN